MIWFYRYDLRRLREALVCAGQCPVGQSCLCCLLYLLVNAENISLRKIISGSAAEWTLSTTFRAMLLVYILTIAWRVIWTRYPCRSTSLLCRWLVIDIGMSTIDTIDIILMSTTFLLMSHRHHRRRRLITSDMMSVDIRYAWESVDLYTQYRYIICIIWFGTQ